MRCYPVVLLKGEPRWAARLVSFGLALLLSSCHEPTGGEVSTGRWITLSAGEKGAEPSWDLRESDAYGMLVSVRIPGFYLDEGEAANELWHQVQLAAQDVTDGIGIPDLPLKRLTVALPEGATDLEVRLRGVEVETLEGIWVRPAQPLLLEGQDRSEVPFAFDRQIYASDADTPSSWARIERSGSFHGVSLGMLEVSAFRYNPVRRTLKVARTMDLEISFGGAQKDAPLAYRHRSLPANVHSVLKGVLCNFDEVGYEVQTTKGSDGIDFLVVAGGALVDSPSLKRWVDFHTQNGLKVAVKSAADLGKTADKIKAEIQKEYDRVKPPELDYVLLVGDVGAVPVKAGASGGKNSDIWYGWLEGGDIIADVGVGRLPAASEAELGRMVQKTLDFQASAEPGAWRKKVTLVGHMQGAPGKYEGCVETIRTHAYKLPAPEFQPLYGSKKAKNTDVVAAMDEGRVIVNYRGHGGSSSWSGWNGSSFSSSLVKQVQNGKRTPLVFSIACSTLAMKAGSKTIGETFVAEEDGAVGYLGAMHPSSTTVNHTFDQQLFYGAWDQGIPKIGDLINYANLKTKEKHGSGATGNITMYAWLGDPSIALPVGSNGDTCADRTGCASGFCVNGICCQSACAAECMACNVPGSLGTCVPAPEGFQVPDGDLCNGDETCVGGKIVQGAPLACASTNPCDAESCDPMKGCVYNPATDGLACPDGDACNGDEVCRGGTCQPGIPLTCDDESSCTADSCSPNNGCLHQPVDDGADCGGGQCGKATCQEGLCKPEGLSCDDHNECTTDTCHPDKGCVSTPLMEGAICGPCMICQQSACTALPAGECDQFLDAVLSCAIAPRDGGSGIALLTLGLLLFSYLYRARPRW